MATVAETLRIGLADHSRRMTLQEFLDAEEEEGYRYELARGILEVAHVPGDPHGLIVCQFYRLFTRYEDAHPGVIDRFGGASEFRLYLPERISGRNPDLAVALLGTPPDDSGDRPPSLAIEVVSEGSEAHTRDDVTKREEYLAFGLREYWIVDRFERNGHRPPAARGLLGRTRLPRSASGGRLRLARVQRAGLRTLGRATGRRLMSPFPAILVPSET